MVIGRRSLLLAGVAVPAAAASAHAQCVTDTSAVDACRGGVRITVPYGLTLDLNFQAGPPLDPRITFTRASTATYFDSSGTMQTAAMNLWLQSADASNAAWGKGGSVPPTVTANQSAAPDGTNSAARVAYPAISGSPPVGVGSQVTQNFTVTANVYSFSVYLKGAVGGEQLWLNATVDAVNYYRTLATLTTSWQRFVLTTPALTAANWYFQIGVDLRDVGQSSKPAQSVYVWGGQLELGSVVTPYIPTTTSANGAPRFDYDPVTHALRGLLIEEARTNLVFPSVIGGTWVSSGNASLGGSVTTPDGAVSTTALIRAGDTTNTTRAYNSAAAVISATTAYTVSMYLRRDATNAYIQVNCTGGTTVVPVAYYDLTAGTAVVGADLLGSVTAKSATITAISGGWYRATFSFTTGAGNTGVTVFVGPCMVVSATGDNRSYVGVVGQGVYVWGAQIEAGTFATSYIPTTAAAVTRALEVCQMPVAAWFNPSAFSMQMEFYMDNTPPGAMGGVSDNAFGENTWYLSNQGCNKIGTNQGTATAFTANALGAVNKECGTFSTTGMKCCVNGGGIGTYAAALIAPSGAIRMSIGTDPWSLSGPFNCHMRRVRVWPRVLSDAEMQQVTR